MHKVMDVTHIDTTSSFKQRAQPLAERDIWYPLMQDQSLAKEKKHIHQLWDALNISFDDYFRIITDNDGFWAKVGQSWDSAFMKWGYPVGTNSHATFNMGREEDDVGQFFQRHEKSIY